MVEVTKGQLFIKKDRHNILLIPSERRQRSFKCYTILISLIPKTLGQKGARIRVRKRRRAVY